MTATEQAESTEGELRRRIAKLERINAALMSHVERVTDKHEGAYSLFQTAIMLDGRVRRRTEELTGLMHRLEQSNRALEAAKDDAEQANRSKTRFLAAASHDLLQPLHAARLSVATLTDLPLEPVAARVVQRVERGLDVIEELIRTLLDISKLEAGVVTPSRGAVAMHGLLDEVAADFGQQAEARGLRFITRCTGDLVVDSDPALLKRVAGNLVSNAVRYTARGGVLVAARRHGEGCRLDVIDTGRGIPDADRDLIFEEFFRGQAAGNDGKGLGLGLAIVRHMVSSLDHRLSFRSRFGHGSWFTLLLPLHRPEGAQGTPAPRDDAADAQRPFATLRALFIRGPAAETGPTLALLEDWGIEVNLAGGREGSAACERPPDFIVVDHPWASRLVADARRRFARAVPAIILLGREPSRGRGGDGCSLLRKPVKPAQLRSLICSLTD